MSEPTMNNGAEQWDVNGNAAEPLKPEMQAALDAVAQNLELHTTSGLVLTRLSPENAQQAYDLIDKNREHFSQFEVNSTTGYETVDQVLESIKFLKRIRFLITDQNGVAVGFVNLVPLPSGVVELTYFIDKDNVGKGYATDAATAAVDFALENLSTFAVVARVNPQNIASQKVLSKIGFADSEVGVTGYITYVYVDPFKGLFDDIEG